MKNKYIPLLCCLLAAALLSGCGNSGASADSGHKALSDTSGRGISQIRETEPPPLIPEYYAVEGSEAEEIRDVCEELALLCNELIANGETEITVDYQHEPVLTQSTIDKVEALLAKNGYPVINSDSVYPEYLENSAGLAGFFESADRGEDIQQSVIYVSRYKSIIYTEFQYSDSAPYYINATIAWDENGSFSISEPYKMNVMDWGITEGKFFYYQIYPHNRHWTACTPIRLGPVDENLYDLYWEYIKPIGYSGCNIFLLDWNSSDYGKLCFNDLFEFLYFCKWGKQVDKDEYEYFTDMQCRLIPADVFEATVLPYFEITLDEFREASSYLEDKNAYPWQEINASNVVYYPEITPEITGCRKNPDGSLTLSVDVFCFDKGPSLIFTHEATIKEAPSGGIQYVGNAVTRIGEYSLPNAVPRLEVQQNGSAALLNG